MFAGSIVALITPMDIKGSICCSSLRKLINYHISSGTSAIVSVGTTGESATLSHEEHGNVVMKTLELANGKISVIAGTGSNDTAEAISLTKRFEDSGVIGCLSVTPYYNRPTQEGLYRHFKAIANSTDLPQILYNVPSRTGCDMLPETIARLAKIKNIIGIKEASGNLSRISQINNLISSDFILMSGDDITALDFMRLGGTGVISVTANIAAKEMVQLCQLASQKKFTQAYKLNQRLMYLHKALFCESNPIAVKWAAKKIGLIKNDNLRLPMTELALSKQSIVEQALIKAGLQ
ncbi:4-hydroxy-tetrahydrodipicolinate synthase [Candidatus Pantoea edessiphila]|uniref:4-hydroxy-tetrahydrodipicolinate synthase n=1 Tax=Candidatus Pantoea edessiphila TaxID=2044610 RepID=A0A2P5T2U5_9GAMM|nr:4-hydroxy-tetrahydrodipicolinate synthase [Candidatus Pantoea edessiphila]PPI88915.1 4-hydroxy-tetrahydrodipicolinate synthase [Candidatus Pantoea edessiphila]